MHLMDHHPSTNLFQLLNVCPPMHGDVTLAEQSAQLLHLKYTSRSLERHARDGNSRSEGYDDSREADVENQNHNVRVLNRYARQEGAIYPNVSIPTNVTRSPPIRANDLIHQVHRPAALMTPAEEAAVRKKRLESRNQLLFCCYVVYYALTSAIQSIRSTLRLWIVSIVVFMELCAYFVPPLQLVFSARLPTDVEWELGVKSTTTTGRDGDDSASLNAFTQEPHTTASVVQEEAIHHHQQQQPRQIMRALDSHGRDMKFAMALQDSCIYSYDLGEQKWSNHVLRHDFHRDIQVMKWKPQSENILAVGCRHGVCLWDIKRRIGGAVGSTEQTGVMMFLKHDVHGYQSMLMNLGEDNGDDMMRREMPGIDDLDWYPLAKHITMFACCSRKDHRVIVWHMIRRKSSSSDGGDSSLFTPEWHKSFITRFNGGIRSLGFSPNGQFLAVFTIGNVFRIYHVNVDEQIHRNRMTNTSSPLTIDPGQWNSEKWKTDGGRSVQCFQWAHNSRFLLISEQGDCKIHVLKMGQQRFMKRQTMDYYFTIDLSEYEFYPTGSTDKRSHRALFSSEVDEDADDEELVAVEDGDDETDSLLRNSSNVTKQSAIRCCGVIKQFRLDQNGERLAVCFEGRENGELIAVMRCDFDTPETKTPVMPLYVCSTCVSLDSRIPTHFFSLLL